MAYNELGVMILGGHLAGDVIDAPAEVDGTRDGSGWDAARKTSRDQYLVCGQGRESLYLKIQPWYRSDWVKIGRIFRFNRHERVVTPILGEQ